MHPMHSVNDDYRVAAVGLAARRTRLDTLLICAGFGGVLFCAVFTLLGALVPEYRFARDTISALDMTPLGWAQRANFFVFGASLMAFAAGLKRELRSGKYSVIIPVLQSLSGAGVVGAGVFIYPSLHVVCDLVAFNSALAVLIAFACYFGPRVGWPGWRAYSAASALLMICFLAAFGVANHPGGPAGAFEKLATATRSLWSTLLVLKLLRGARLKPLSI